MSQILNYSLQAMQELNEQIYGHNNKLHFSPMRMVMRIGRFAGRLGKSIDCRDVNVIAFHTTMSFSWSLALANKFGISLEQKLWERFPGVCSHCGFGPCECEQIKSGVLPENITPSRILAECPKTFDGFQIMFAKIYPKNTSLGECRHVVDEVFELGEAVDNFTGTNDLAYLPPCIAELCDVTAHLCGVATCARIGLAGYMEKYFSNGCYECHATPCHCGFPASVTVSPRRKVENRTH